MANIYVSSGTSFSATINITYPSGSTCTVSNYKKTWTAPSTTGSWSCKVNEVGVYTVKAVSGSKSSTAEVIITTDGQTKTVSLNYDLILFNNGLVKNIDWDSSAVDSTGYCNNTVSDTIYLSGYVYDNGVVFVAPSATRGISTAIDLTNYDTVNVRVKEVANNTGSAEIRVGTSALGKQTATGKITVTAGKTSSLDISSVTGSKYISLWVMPTSGTYGNTINVKFDKVWLGG